jgi:hypothetical protein
MFIRCLGFGYAVLLLAACVFAQVYDQLLHHWDYDQNAPLNIKQAGIEKRDGLTIYDISFSSPVGERSIAVGPNGGAVTAYLVVPAGRGPFPAVIFGHWCMPGSDKKNRTEFLDEAVVLARSGVISLLPDHVIVHPGFVADSTPLNDQQIAVEVQQDVSKQPLEQNGQPRNSPAAFAIQHNCRAADSLPHRRRTGVVSFFRRLPAVGLGHLLYLPHRRSP